MILQKTNYSFLSILIFCIAAIFIGYIVSQGQLVTGSLIIIISISIALAIFSFLKPKVGVVLVFIFSFIITLIGRFWLNLSLPLGTILEIPIGISFMGLILHKALNNDRDWSFLSSPITIVLSLILLYNAFQVINPNNTNIVSSLFFVKHGLAMFIFYIICLYCFQDRKFMFLLIRIWIGFSFLVALYACYQEWVGFMKFEEIWLRSDDDIWGLFYIGGRVRKFSFLDNPSMMGMLMAASSIFLAALLSGKFSLPKKAGFGVMIIFMLLAIGYSGTRTAYAMIVGGLMIIFLINIDKIYTIVAAFFVGLGFLAIMYGPFNNGTILRIRSTFYPKNDASFNVREINRKAIQPYIYEHPIGGGLGTTGSAGEEINPGHRLAGFPPDSEYLKVTLETGVIGFILLLISYFVIMNTMIKAYYRSTLKSIKVYYSALIAALFAIILGNYAQETSGMYPNDIIFYFFFAVAASLYKYDNSLKNKNYNYES